MLVLCNFLRKLMVSNKKIHRALRTRTTLNEQYPLEKFFIFTIYQNYTLALKLNCNKCGLKCICVKSEYWSIVITPHWKIGYSLCCLLVLLLIQVRGNHRYLTSMPWVPSTTSLRTTLHRCRRRAGPRASTTSSRPASPRSPPWGLVHQIYYRLKQTCPDNVELL